MDLRCKIGHLFSSTVDVDGVGVEVGAEGIARNVPEEAAATLLLNKTGWARHVAEVEQPKAPAAPPPKATEKQDEPSETADAPASSEKPKKRATSTSKKRRGVRDVLGLGGKDED